VRVAGYEVVVTHELVDGERLPRVRMFEVNPHEDGLMYHEASRLGREVEALAGECYVAGVAAGEARRPGPR